MRFQNASLLAALLFGSLVAHATTPQITGISPTSGATGTQVQINGSGFGATQGSSAVAFNGVNAAVTGWSDTQITASVPATATTGPVTVRVNSTGSNTNIYFNVPPPRITGISPLRGSPGTQVTISGARFQTSQGSSSISFNGYTPTINSWSDTQIVATVPSGAVSGPIWVTVNSVMSNQDVLLTVSHPVVSSLFPSSGVGGAQLTINGSGFGATQGSSYVTTGAGYTATIVSWGDSEIVCTIPDYTNTGAVSVVVGGVTSNTDKIFTVAAPQVTSISPASGAVGTQVTITGTNFQSTRPTYSYLYFNNANASIVSWSNAQIVATVPANATTGPVVVGTNNNLSSNENVTFTMPRPVVASVSPSSGPTGTQVQINGSGFGTTQGSSLAAFNGVNATIVSWSDTQIVATVPSIATTGAVTVSEGGVTSNGSVYYTVPPPHLSGISPASGPVGTQVTINGSGFQASQGSSSVSFNGYSAAISSWSDTQIVATVPTYATTGPVKVTVNGVASNQDVAFTTPRPNITGLSPSGGPIGSQVQVNGSGFGASQGSSTITFNGTSASAVSWSDTQIIATVPSGATTGALVVTEGGASSNTNQTFTVASVLVSSVSPKAGPTGTQVTVSGSGFGASQGGNTISFNNTAATSITSWSDVQIVATVPTGATSGPVKVTSGGVDSNTSIGFTVGAVVVNSLSPSTAAAGSQVTINGSGFGASQGSNYVMFNYGALSVVNWSNMQITVTAPSSVMTAAIIVSVGGVYSNTDVSLTVVGPTVTSVSPTSGPVGTQVTINGSGFGASQGSNSVTFNSASASVTSWSDTQIVATVPSTASAGPVRVTVGGAASNTNVYFTVPPPQVTGVSPSSGSIGTQVTITGSNFQATQPGSAYVAFNGVYAATISSWSNTQIAAIVPAGATSGAVSVYFNGTTSNQDVEFALPNPTVVSVSPSSGPVGTQVTVNGSGFGSTQGANTIAFSGAGGNYTNATVTSWSDAQIVAAVPSTTTLGSIRVTNGGVASNTNVYFNVPTPHVSGIAPASGGVGTQVTISGSGFQATAGSSSIYINGYAPGINSWSDTQIVATVAAGTTTGAVKVTVNGVASNQNVQFTMPNPVITAITPSEGPVSIPVVIDGSGFGSTQGTVTFSNLNATIVSWSDTQIVAKVPAAAASGQVKVVAGGVTSTPTVSYTVTAPQITSLSPNVGGWGNAVTISGSGFQASQGQGTVYFNGSGGSTILSWSDTQIVATVPLNVSTGPVRVLANNSTLSNYMAYTVPNNVISGIAPVTGPVGTQVTVTGTGFGATQGTSTVTFSGQPAASIASWSDTQVVATVPNTAITGPVKATVNNVPSNVNQIFTVPGPWITGVTPFGGVAGTQVTLAGTAFQASQGSNAVTFNGMPATVSSWSDTQIVATVPPGATTGQLLVTVNSISSPGRLFEVPNPAISGVTPAQAPLGGTVTITGSGFGQSYLYSPDGIGNIYVGWAELDGHVMPIASWSDTQITAVIGGNGITQGTGNLTVVRYNATSNGVLLMVEGAPTVTAITPSTGPVGSTVTISGSGFGSTQGPNGSVQFNGSASAAITSWSDTQIVATVPPGAVTGPVGVVSDGIGGPTADFVVNVTTQVTDSLGHTSSYTSANVGGAWLATSSTGSGCSSCTVRGNLSDTLDSVGNVLNHTDELGHVTSFTYDDANNLTSQSQALDSSNTVTTSYTYNSFGEPLTVTDPLGNVTTNTYDANGNLLTVITPAPDSLTPGSITRFAYDGKGQLTQITDPLNHVTTLTYNPVGLIATITDAQNHVTTYGYDAHGNRTSVTDALNNQTTFTYDAMDRLTRITYPDTTFASFGYDSRGRRTSVTDQNGKVTSYAYDDADRLTSVTDAALHVTTYAYDTENNLLSITDANNHTTSFSYDAFGRVTQATFPSTMVESYLYDAAGNLTSKTDRNNHSILYVYDALNRLTHKGYPDATGVDYVYDLAGKIKQVTDPTGTYAMAYDNMGRLIGTSTQYSFLPGHTYINTYAYDAASNRTQLTLPDNSTDTFQYDTLNRMTSLADSQAGSFGLSYDQLSRRTQLTRPNGINTNYSYDSLSHLLSVLHQNGTTTLDGAIYTYDNAGNRTAKTNKLNNLTEQYTYDPLYQLTQVTQGATTTESYSYDAVGNRLSSVGVSSYTYNSSNELTTTPTVSFTYDANGNTLTKTDPTGTRTYTWDFENRLTSVVLPGSGGTVTFKYDPFGRRIQKAFTQNSTATVTNYLYDAANTIAEVDATGDTLARYSQGPTIDEALAMARAGASSFYEEDGLGSVTSLSSSTGTISNSYTYDAFGNLIASTGSLSNPFQYTGRDFDPETGLRYYRARYYAAENGRFLSEDPLKFRGADVNFYRYVYNNPLVLVDPTGRGAKGAAIGGIVGVLVGGYVGCELGAGAGAGAGALAGAPTGFGELVTIPVGGLAGCIGGGLVGAGLGGAGGAVAGSYIEDHGQQMLNYLVLLTSAILAKCTNNPTCQAHYNACQLTSLADYDGNVYGSRRCEECRMACVRNGGRWPAFAPRSTGSVRCDYWNFRSVRP